MRFCIGGDFFVKFDKKVMSKSPAVSIGMYGASVLGLAALLANFSAFALVALLVMSVWHFGEQSFAQDQQRFERWMMRCALGGASVMWPMLLSPQAMQALLQTTWPADFLWLVAAWRGMTWLWLAALALALILMAKRWRVHMRLLAEVSVLAALNAWLSPILAFTLFFGIHHSPAHILRMRRISGDHRPAWRVTLLVTWVGMGLLAWVMWVQRDVLIQEANWWLRWMIVALTAVTLPHLILVAKANPSLHPSRATSG
ncbi:MAG: beta-carotene 15,15'-dioxygenase, Brp/Blh family [Brachymonas sp.]